ncbi:MAG TPA: hypothetical protein VFP39_08740 [Gemmatimonadales bacterium]|nr:hypothetical protein [Gemmatimonadales bacterium]
MDVTVEQLRRQYERFSDEALIEAHELGESAYLPRAWVVITEEMARRGLMPERADPGISSEPITSETAQRLVNELLEAGLSRATIGSRLRDDGLTDADIERVIGPALEQWRAAQEQRAGVLMRRGAMWAGGGLLITVASYAAAVQSRGGTYIITWGAMLFGVVRFAEGLLLAQRARQR